MFTVKQVANLFRPKSYLKECRLHLSYVQGQSPEPKIREYFYFIDHEGMVSAALWWWRIYQFSKQILLGSSYHFRTQLFLDDARMKNFTSCFKEKKFLKFFFDRIRFNRTDRYTTEFPFISLCGRERNFIRCDDVPIVYTHVLAGKEGFFCHPIFWWIL